MSDQRERDLELEANLREMYAKFTPPVSEDLADGIQSMVRQKRAASDVRTRDGRRFRGLMPLGLAAVVTLVAVFLAIPLLTPGPTAPAPSAPTPAASSSGSVRPTGTVAAPSETTPTPTVTADSSSDYTRMWSAWIDEAGSIRSGGFWAVAGTSLFLSFDGGETWSTTKIPARDPDALVPATAVFDAGHAWTLRAGPGSTTGTSDSVVSLLVYRTSDGGASWQSTAIPGNFFEAILSLTFVDAYHGILLAFPSGGSGGVVYRTSDGGATWQAGPKHNLDWTISVSDATTLWTSWPGPSAMCYGCGRPLLQVSRDAGVTWSDVALPGYADARTSDLLGAAAPPTFLSPRVGYFAVNSAAGTDPTRDGTSKIYGTRDGGKTWALVATAPHWLDSLVAVDASHWFAVAGGVSDMPATEIATDDGGVTWHEVRASFPSFTSATCWFTDPEHGAAILAPGLYGYPEWVLYVTADGGRNWGPAPLGE